MRHPFDLKLDVLETLDLNFEEPVSPDEGSQVNGGIIIGGCYTPCPLPPSPMTALFGEGGCFPHGPLTRPGFEAGGPGYTTLALGEEGGGFPLPL